MRDRFGVRKLGLGSSHKEYEVSSESCALTNDIDNLREVKNGE